MLLVPGHKSPLCMLLLTAQQEVRGATHFSSCEMAAATPPSNLPSFPRVARTASLVARPRLRSSAPG
eukprot:scaffold72089_cov61-Phaeocystis_antarctica.AAC.2